ncbi:MAG: glycosyltransferase, partial [Humidesulfovibrio sp.]|nr:glycosyltransferase [Humidesulfovibrio sp.]
MRVQPVRRGSKLVAVVATCDRLAQLKVSVESILRGTRAELQLVVADGGSSDGTQQYLLDHPRITPMLQGAKIGPGKSYNEVWRQADGDYTCWLSDDTELVPGALDLALEILQAEPKIGMVGLKTKDTMGPFVQEPYIGGISEFGIINCNHGVLPMSLLRDVGYFNED